MISLDFELHWGVRDKVSIGGPYTPNLIGARTIIPRLLAMFEEFEIAATWGTVGLLFARSREQQEACSPQTRPAYLNRVLSSYVQRVGGNESEDPYHFAPSLIEQIQRTPNQEIATHTFSHYFCCEDGQTAEAFRADLAAACAIATQYGIRLRSIVFPRNQHNPNYDHILSELGICAYRGNPYSRLWQFVTAKESSSKWKRAGRLLDAYVRVSGDGTYAWEEIEQASGLSNVRASFLLRSYRPALRHLEGIRLQRICRSIRHAAETGRIVHLWWHPHNFGVNQDRNLQFLRRVLLEFSACRERHGMHSLSMANVDEWRRARVKESDRSATSSASVSSQAQVIT